MPHVTKDTTSDYNTTNRTIEPYDVTSQNTSEVMKAIFPVAGMGTRFFPATKATPKEMMPIIDKPLIQYAVEEAVQSGITELIFITNITKHSVKDHFDENLGLEQILEERSKYDLIEKIKNILPANVTCKYICQKYPLGLGDAIKCAKSVVGNQPFAVLLADDLIKTDSNVPCLRQVLDAYNDVKSSVVAVQEVPVDEANKYGIVDVTENFSLFEKINGIVEKPSSKDAPSNFAAIGRYILTADIFDCLSDITSNANEFQLTDAIQLLLNKQAVFALNISGKRYDCGNKFGYLQAIVDYGITHPEIGVEFKQFLQKNKF